MTALAANYNRARYGSDAVNALLPAVPCLNAVHIYAGSMVSVGAAGQAKPAASGDTRVIGVAEAEADNSAGAAGAINCNVRRGAFTFANKAGDLVVQGDLGASCYVEDDNTVRHTAGGGIAAGKVLGFEGSLVIVEVGI